MRRRRNFTGIYLVIVVAIAFLAVQFWQLAHNLAPRFAPTTPVATPEATEPASPDLFAAYYDAAESLMASMSLEEKASQLFLVHFPESTALADIAAASPGGFILFAKDFQSETPDFIRAKLQDLQDAATVKFLFGVDEEGGTVTRVSRFRAYRDTKFASPQALYTEGGLDRIVADSHEKSALLSNLGLNLNLAPVADIPTSPTSFIYARSLGQDAATTARYTASVVVAMNEDRMISSLKHFPGYGDNADTHTGVAFDERSYEQLAGADLLPFISGIEAGAPTILVSHNVVTAIDAMSPASLSPAVHEVLRGQLGFTGIIMTDDLDMDAVQSYVADGQAAVAAIAAGNDLIITSDFLALRQEVLAAIDTGTLDESTLDTAVRRILALKFAYGILDISEATL